MWSPAGSWSENGSHIISRAGPSRHRLSIGSRSGHGLVVRRDKGGRRSVLFVQVDPVDLRCATNGFELRRHGDHIRMVRRHFCQSPVYKLGNMTVLFFGVVVGVGTKRGLVGMAPSVHRTTNDGHDVDSLCTGTFGANGSQRGLQTIFPGLFGGQLPGPCLIDNPVDRKSVLGARDGKSDIISPADVGRTPRIAVGFGVFVRIAVVGESPNPTGLEIAKAIVKTSIPR